MIAVQFLDVDEFFAEIEGQTTSEQHDVLRVCVLRMLSSYSPLYFFIVVAGVINDVGHLVELRFQPTEDPTQSHRKAIELAEQIRVRARDLGFDVRSGRYLESEKV